MILKNLLPSKFYKLYSIFHSVIDKYQSLFFWEKIDSLVKNKIQQIENCRKYILYFVSKSSLKNTTCRQQTNKCTAINENQ